MAVRPERIRVRLRDDAAAGATPLQLPDRRMWPVGLIFAAMFAIFAGVAWTVVGTMSRHAVRDVFDLMFFLFQGFWLLGWSVGVLALAAGTVFFFLYHESARLQDGRLVYVPRLGPFKIIIDYDLLRVRNVRLENAGADDKVKIRFDYGEETNTLGDTMARTVAEQIAGILRDAVQGAGSFGRSAPAPSLESARRENPAASPPAELPAAKAPPALTSLSGLTLLGANLIPLAGVLLFRWDLATVLVLFWAESAVIGFYTVLKMAIVGKWPAIFATPFFIGHYGGFMTMHFLFIYLFFVRGVNAVGRESGVRDALLRIFVPLWITLMAMFISHGVSFVSNFLGRREYEGSTIASLMTAPYNRIMVMQLTLIFGGWIILLLKSPVGALVLLIVLKTALDFTAHRKEHAGGIRFAYR
jgi:hypothetical protein